MATKARHTRLPPAPTVGSSRDGRFPLELFAAIVLGACAVAHIVVTRLSWSGIPLQTDTGMWAYIGGRILDGALPYRDLWESKPPGIYYTFAGVEWLFGRGTDGVLLWLDAVLSFATLAITYAVARCFASRVAAAGAVLLLSFVFCHRTLADWGDNVEKFVALFEMLACYLVLRSFNAKRDWLCWLAAGVCCGMAGLFKQTGVIFLVAAVLTTLLLAIPPFKPGNSRPQRALLLIVGAALPWLPTLAGLLAAGIFKDFWQQAVLYDLVRVGSGDVERSRLLNPAHWSSVFDTFKLAAILLGPALLGALLTLRQFQPLKPPRREAEPAANRRILFVTVYWLLATAVFPLAPYGYGHYLLQAAPPAAVLAASVFSQSPRATRHRRWTAAAILLVVLGLWPLGDHFRFTLDGNYQFRKAYDTIHEHTDRLTQAVREHTAPTDLVMLWPPDYAVTYYAQRRTPLEASNSDVIFKGKIGRLSPPMPELLARLQSSPPAAIFDTMPVGVAMPGPGQPGNEPTLVVPPGSFTLFDPPDENHSTLEGRLLAPLKRWIGRNYGGQEAYEVCIVYYRGRPWRPWQQVLLSSK